MEHHNQSFLVSLLSGGIAGTTVDVSLYPLDTIKTRLQAPQGFLAAGGFRGIYNGLSAAAAGSAPGAALFFSTYEMSKKLFRTSYPDVPEPVQHLLSAGIGEVAACLVRVPTEVVKQRMQTGLHESAGVAVRHIMQSPEGILGFYSGFKITIFREIPFAFIQFPIYERIKVLYSKWKERDIYSWEAALCGSISGGIAAAITTPLDVMKTRLMLKTDKSGVAYHGVVDVFKRLCEEGQQSKSGKLGVFFSGVQPRVFWISIGGFFFFGAYEQASSLLNKLNI